MAVIPRPLRKTISSGVLTRRHCDHARPGGWTTRASSASIRPSALSSTRQRSEALPATPPPRCGVRSEQLQAVVDLAIHFGPRPKPVAAPTQRSVPKSVACDRRERRRRRTVSTAVPVPGRARSAIYLLRSLNSSSRRPPRHPPMTVYDHGERRRRRARQLGDGSREKQLRRQRCARSSPPSTTTRSRPRTESARWWSRAAAQPVHHPLSRACRPDDLACRLCGRQDRCQSGRLDWSD